MHSRKIAVFCLFVMITIMGVLPVHSNEVSKFQMVDITENCNRMLMGREDEEYSWTTGDLMGQQLYDLDTLDTLADQNGVFEHQGIPYKFYQLNNRDKGINTAVSPGFKETVYIKNGHYKSVNFLASYMTYNGEQVGESNPALKDFPVTIKYTDGTQSNSSLTIAHWAWSHYYGLAGQTPALELGIIDYNIDWNNNWNVISKTREHGDGKEGLMFAYSVATDSNKQVESITFGSQSKQAYIFAVTAVGADNNNIPTIIGNSQWLLPSLEDAHLANYAQVAGLRQVVDYANANGLQMPIISKFTSIEQKIANLLEQTGAIEVYVSENGSSSGDGTPRNPVSAIQEANRIAANNRRAIDSQMPVHIIFRGGNYYIDETVQMDKFNSGSVQAPTVYKPFEGEKVQISTSKPLDYKKLKLVTEPTELARIPQEAQGKVMYLDLTQQGINNIPDFSRLDAMQLSVNGQQQQMAMYPNRGYTAIKNVITKGDSTEYSGGGDYGSGRMAVFEYIEDRGAAWQTADQAHVQGYLAVDYRLERVPVASVSDGAITLGAKTNFGVANSYAGTSRRYRIVNLLEELDSAGEWFADKNTNRLYYYPHAYQSIQTMEFTNSFTDLFNLNQVRNIHIKDMEFYHIGGNVFNITNGDNITIENCSFQMVAQAAVNAVSSVNLSIKDNIVGDSGKAFYVEGGDKQTLTPSNNVITNNHIYRVTWGYPGGLPAVFIMGVGATFSNNLMHDMPMHAVNYTGNDHKILGNEIYDVCKETNDVSAIYTGRTYIERGTEIAYNYIRDIRPDYYFIEGIDPKKGGFNYHHAIYLDDGQCGQYVHHNIFKNVWDGININSGQSNTFENNIVVTSDTGFRVTKFGAGSQDRKTRETNQYNSIKDNPAYAKYPNLAEGIQGDNHGNPAFNTSQNNLFVDRRTEFLIEEPNYKNGGIFENNQVFETFDDFVNPDAQDYRIKLGSSILETIPGILTEEYDINQIGLWSIGSLYQSAKNFDLITVSKMSQGHEFRWEQAFSADEYKLTVSNNQDLSDPIIDQVVKDTKYYTQALNEQEKIYWKVSAINTGRKTGDNWENNTGIAMADLTTLGDYSVAWIQPETDSGEVITSLEDYKNQSINITFDAINQQPCKLIFALKDGDGRVVSIRIHDLEIQTQWGRRFKEFSLPDSTSNDHKIKGYIWKNTATVIPLTGELSIY